MNPLQEYNRKRDFKKTSEPRAKVLDKNKTKNRIFVVQEHHASHLHYDFRLELDGVLKSWAVPKGPSMNPADKRLAVEVEDHPLSYAKFKGTIPEGEYGAGEVYTWDHGTWMPLNDPHDGLKKGRLEFSLKGGKLKGDWLLIRTARSSGKKAQWLLMKRKDALAEKGAASTTGVSTKAKSRTVKKAKAAAVPEFIAPQLAQLVDVPPEGDDWIHEIKFDGYRIQAHCRGSSVQLVTRSGQDWSAKFPPVLGSLEKMIVKDAIFDGEIVSLDTQGRSDFQILQNVMNTKDYDRLVYYVFDLLYFNGEDLRSRPLVERKKLLQRVLKTSKADSVRYVEDLRVSGKEFLAVSCEEGLEGIISKRKDSVYVSERNENWVKTKCKKRQEFVIGGYTDPQGKRQGFGALLLGVYEENKLRFVGKVGTGFNNKVISSLLKKLQKLEVGNSPFKIKSPHFPGVHWLLPKLAAEIDFSNWTRDKTLRVPVYKGLREDKPTAEIHVETPQSLELTHEDKVLFPTEELTKGDVAKYYQDVAASILPHLENRPLSLLRCPNGTGETCFLQKHYKEGSPAGIQSIEVAEKKKTEGYVAVNTAEGLTALVQMGTLEIHTWNSSKEDLDRPDQIVMDFDPGPGVTWKQMTTAALELKEILDQLKLKSFVKLSGGKGIHVHIPIATIYTWDQIKNFSKTLAMQMASAQPKVYIYESAKDLRKGKIYIDYLRNARGSTAVAPYSLRAKEVSSVALPIEWSELAKIKSSNEFTLDKALKKISQRKKDPWADYFKSAQKIPILKPG